MSRNRDRDAGGNLRDSLSVSGLLNIQVSAVVFWIKKINFPRIKFNSRRPRAAGAAGGAASIMPVIRVTVCQAVFKPEPGRRPAP
jgi:hypothetical protein